MTIKVQIEGLDELRKHFSNMDEAFNIAVGDAIEDTVLAIRNEVIDGIRQPGTGRTYEKYNPRRTHRASAPGQPPATDTGRLISSIYFDLKPLTATVGSRLAYAYWLEFGTRKMKPRPIWMKTVNRESERLRERIISNLKAAAK
jgi:HK97 gp10 family phage protein